MQRLNNEQARRIDDFITGAKKVLLFYHRDADGVCSASLMLRFFPDFRAFAKKGPRLDDAFLASVEEKKPDLVIFLDLPVDQEAGKITKLLKVLPGLKVIVIDHHLFEKDMNAERVIHVNPLLKKSGVYISVSYLTYEVLLKLFGGKAKEFIWIALMGAIGDYDLKDSQELLKECRKRYPHLIGGDPLKSELANGVELISSAITIRKRRGAKKVVELLAGSKVYEDFANTKLLKENKKRFDEELRKTIESAKLESHPAAGLKIFEIETDFGLVSNVSTHFSEKYPDSIVVVRKREDDEWKFSVRCQSGRVNTGLIVKKAVKGIGTGGGHPKASAGITNEWDKFKKRFIKELTKESRAS
jgi:single-stranded DNA-specific DHH superfamily exonuclease